MDKQTGCEARVGVMYRSSGPNTGSNPGGGRILNIKKLLSAVFELGYAVHKADGTPICHLAPFTLFFKSTQLNGILAQLSRFETKK